MNHKTLKDSAHNLESLDAGTVQDLIEMTKRFPYFAWPFVLLAKQYQQKQDFRAEALMHQAALRVHDRSWLYTFSHASKPAIAHPTQPLAESKIKTPTLVEALSKTTETQTPVIEPIGKTESIIPVAEPTAKVATVIPTPVEALSETSTTEIQIPVVEPIGKTESIIPVAEPTVKTATEIPTPVEALSENSTTETQSPVVEPTGKTESIIPVAEPTAKIETEIPTPVEALSETSTTEKQIPVAEPIGKTESIIPVAEPTGKTETIIPVAEPTVKVATEIPTPITPLPVARPFVSDPKRVQLKNERPPLFTPERGQVYDLERIFSEKQPVEQEPHKGKASTDFYAWLNTAPPKAIPPNVIAAEPKQVPLPEIPESIAQQKSIIENFLINKPSISRPKQEFFKPEKAQKKGEILSGAIVTETLARIYLKQDNPQKAIWAYQQLQLKFPEKKTYFANLISQIETEQNKS